MEDRALQAASTFLVEKLPKSCGPEATASNFFQTARFSKGRLVHAEYGMLLEKITKADLIALFEQLGVDRTRFYDNSHLVCRNGHCVLGSGYCDEDSCF